MPGKKRYILGDYVVDVRRYVGDSKRAVVLIHGIGVSGDYFIPFAEILSKMYDVHVIDMPGYGDTPKPTRPLKPLEQADVAAEYIRKVGVKTAIIIGQSMGCQTAAQLVRRHPNLCEKLVLIGPTVNKWERWLPFQAFRLFCDTFVESPKMNAVIFRDYLRMGPKAYFITSRYMIADHIEKTLAGMDVPVCIVRGKKDGIAPWRWVEYLSGIAKNAEVHHVKGPHNIQFTNAKELFAACDDFLKK